MNLITRFLEFVEQHNLFHPGDKLVLAVSGGVDSSVLCDVCKKAGYDFLIAHCNFQLRGEESDRDENFVRKLGERYAVEVFVKKFETEEYAQSHRMGIQEAARKLRYEWFDEIVNSRGSSRLTTNGSRLLTLLLTAHHADDNVETVLMNFCRGTGLQGLEGIPVMFNYIRRPLLNFWKEELVQYAKQNQLLFVEDSSNLSTRYARNLFRHDIIPMIALNYPTVRENIIDNTVRFKEINSLYKISVENIKKKLCKPKNDEVHIPVKQLMAYASRALIYEIISDYGFSERQIDEVVRLAESESGKYIQSSTTGHRIIKFRSWFVVSNIKASPGGIVVIDGESHELTIENHQLKIEKFLRPADFRLPTSSLVACLDAKEICFPLMLRPWKQGDYFYPLGMKKKKKLARFFIDQRLSKTDREKISVIEMNRKILWVIGQRIDERFKVTVNTKEILKLEIVR